MEFIGAAPSFDLTYSDVFLVPRHSEVGSRLSVSLAPNDGTPATLPLVASNMNSVTGPRLAAVMARRGGLGVLPQDLSFDELRNSIHWIKSQPTAWDSPIVFDAEATAAQALERIPLAPGSSVVVERDGAEVLGTLTAAELSHAPGGTVLRTLVRGPLLAIEASEILDARSTFDLVAELTVAAEDATVCVMQAGKLVGTLTRRSALRSTIYAPAVDRSGRLAVAAAVGINGDVAERARALAEAGADVLVVDTAHGHQASMLRALEAVAGTGLPVVAGNIVTADGVRDLVGAGATIMKVGVGPGAMCTTRMMTAVGRPQFSAVLETAEAARQAGAHVWADGGVRYPRDVALALAAGAASVMIGSWFAGTAESPGALHTDASGRQYKESWGMASTKAVQARFGQLDTFERARKELFAEGISSSKIYLDPQRPGVEDLIDMITSGVRSSFTYAGAASLNEFHERARVGVQSAAGYEEGKALPVSW